MAQPRFGLRAPEKRTPAPPDRASLRDAPTKEKSMQPAAAAPPADLESGGHAFCCSCARLFRRHSPDDDTDDGQPRCSDCAAKARLLEAVSYAAARNELKEERGTLSRLVALAAAPSDETPRAAAVGRAPSSVLGAASTEEEHEAGVAALHDLIVFTRRENNELRKRLHAAQGESVSDEVDATAAAAEAAAAGEYGGPVAEMATLFLEIIPAQLRQTSRYRPLNEALIELLSVWRDRERRLHALQAALLGAEATCVTLQEELLLVEASEVSLGSLVHRQQAELNHVRQEAQAIAATVAEKEQLAHESDVRRREAEALLRLRHDAEAALRHEHRAMQKLLADAHTSLGQFVAQQQTRRAKELEERKAQLASWHAEMRRLLQSGGHGGGGGGGRMRHQRRGREPR